MADLPLTRRRSGDRDPQRPPRKARSAGLSVHLVHPVRVPWQSIGNPIRWEPMAEGFIRRRGDAWQVIIYAGRDPVTGRKRQVSRNVRGTKREAQAVRAQLLVEVGKGQHEGTDVTFGELVERWYEMAAPDWSPSTATERRRLLDRVILPKIGRTRLQKLRTADLDRLYRELRASGGHQGRPLAPATVRKVHVVVRRALQQAVRWGWLSANPAVHASPPRVPRHEITPPSPEEVERLLELAEADDPDLAVL